LPTELTTPPVTKMYLGMFMSPAVAVWGRRATRPTYCC
jgi:hypothetical protein